MRKLLLIDRLFLHREIKKKKFNANKTLEKKNTFVCATCVCVLILCTHKKNSIMKEKKKQIGNVSKSITNMLGG